MALSANLIKNINKQISQASKKYIQMKDDMTTGFLLSLGYLSSFLCGSRKKEYGKKEQKEREKRKRKPFQSPSSSLRATCRRNLFFRRKKVSLQQGTGRCS